jgi:hypothetical protein
MYPFRTLPDTIDGVICGNCGHPVWDHCISDSCAECGGHDPGSACRSFSLYGFVAANLSAPAKLEYVIETL